MVDKPRLGLYYNFITNLLHYHIFKFYSSYNKTGSRGYLQEIWPNCKTHNIKNFDARFTPEYTSYNGTIRTGRQEMVAVDQYKSFDPRYSSVCAKFSGFFSPPYTGEFKLLINADDRGEFWFSDCQKNCSGGGSNMVCIIPVVLNVISPVWWKYQVPLIRC